MARKKFPTLPEQKKPRPGIGGRPSAKLPLHAHPRLNHGFLVRLPTGSSNTTRGAKRTFIAVANVKARARNPSDTKHEGPADDATFH